MRPLLRHALWAVPVLGAATLLAATGGRFVEQLLTQVLVLWCFGLSYQILFGRTGMLSFGHAVNFGLAAFVTAHAVRVLPGNWPVYELLPLVGLGTGLVCALILGYPVTRRSGVAFAMVTLGLGELVAACFLMFPGFFGGEAGVTLQRTRVLALLPFDYGREGAQLALSAVWTGVVLAATQWLAATPLGLATLAVRENPQRAEFSGFNAANVRWSAYLVSSALAGVAGSLSALAYEIVTVDAVSLHSSANVLLLTVIGGVGSAFGPLLGALFLSLMQSVVSEWTRAWLFYYGFVFVALVWLAPEGLHGLWRRARATSSPWPTRARTVSVAMGFAVVMTVFIETLYQVALGEPSRLPGVALLDPTALRVAMVCSGAAVLFMVARVIRRQEPRL